MEEPTANAVADAETAIESIAVVHALAVERAGLMDADADVRVYQSGPGAVRAASAARAALEAGACALVSWGLAGGLEPELAPGAVVVPSRIVTADGQGVATDAAWGAALVEALEPDFSVHGGALLTADHVLASPREKARAALATGTIAVDLESAAVAAVAAEAGVPFAAVRVVADAVADALPARIETWMAESGRQRLGPVVRAALKPAAWSTLIMLAQRYALAHRVLEAVAEQLVARGFARPRSGVEA